MRLRTSISEPEPVSGQINLPSPAFPLCSPPYPACKLRMAVIYSTFHVLSPYHILKLNSLLALNFPWYSCSYGGQNLTLRGEEQNSTTDNRVTLMETDTFRLNIVKDKI